MKKGVIVILVLLAVIVLVSPAIVGRLAEQSMDENLNWAAQESGSLKVTSENFTRGWFSSAGQHRVEVQDGELLTALQTLGIGADPDELPVLIINTKLDHGLIPVSSMSREKGSLAPGLGSAISTMQVELPGGEIVDLPGTIYSKVGLGGELQSNYVLAAGNYAQDGATATWGDTDIDITTNPSTGRVEFDGSVGSLSVGEGSDAVSLGGLTFKGTQTPTKFGFSAGDIAFTLSDLSVQAANVEPVGIQSMSASGNTTLDGDDVNADATVKLVMQQLPQVGSLSIDFDFRLAGADAGAIGRIQQALERSATTMQDPMAIYGTIESDLKQLFAAGFDLNFERLDITLPQGTVSSKWLFSFGEEDPATFEWTTLLLSTEASVDLSIPAALVDMAGQSSPQVAAAIGGGFLIPKGDVYELKAQLKKGLATVNGAPIPIPLGGM